MYAKCVIAIGIVLAVSTPSGAAQQKPEYKITLTGNDLFALCSGTDIQTMKPHATAEWQCLGYIQGVMDLWGKLRTFRAVTDKRFDIDYCPGSNGIRGNEAITVVRNYLAGRSASERARDGASRFVLLALEEAYPCERNHRSPGSSNPSG